MEMADSISERRLYCGKNSSVLQNCESFLNVDLEAWVYGTIEKHREGKSWRHAWFETYLHIGGSVRVQRPEKLPDGRGENALPVWPDHGYRHALQHLRDSRTVELLQERHLRHSSYAITALQPNP